MTVRVELFGVARKRAGTATVTVSAGHPLSLGSVVAELGERFPALAAECFEGNGLRSGYVANIGGDRFIQDPDTMLDSGTTLLIMSSDAGG